MSKQEHEESDGVIYTPSSERQNELEETKKIDVSGIIRKDSEKKATFEESKVEEKTYYKHIKKKSTPFAVFFITTVFIGILISLAVFILVSRALTGIKPKPQNSIPTAMSTPSPSAGVNEATVANNKSITALIKKVNPSLSSFEVYDIYGNTAYNLYVDTNTEMKDKFGKIMVYAEFHVGEIVDIDYNTSSNLIKKISVSNTAWFFKDHTNIIVDSKEKSIKVDSLKYLYDENLQVIFDGKPCDINLINPVDVLTLKGIKDKVYFIEVQKGHGIINIPERQDITDGVVEIDTTMSFPLNEARAVVVPEGVKHIVIKGKNIDVDNREIIIQKGEMYNLDLSNIQVKSGVIAIKISEPDAILKIDGATRAYGEPIVLEYGEYTISATKEGFEDWEKKIKIASPKTDLNISLVKIVKTSLLRVSTTPPGAEIYLDNVYLGLSPVETKVEYGMKTIVIKKEGYVDITFPWNINRESIPLNITMQQKNTSTPVPSPSSSPSLDSANNTSNINNVEGDFIPTNSILNSPPTASAGE